MHNKNGKAYKQGHRPYSQGLGGGTHQEDQNAEKNEEILRKNQGKGWKMRKFLENIPTCLTGSETLHGCGPAHKAFVRLCMNRVCSTCCIDNYKPIVNLELFCLPLYKFMGTRKVKIISNKSTSLSPEFFSRLKST